MSVPVAEHLTLCGSGRLILPGQLSPGGAKVTKVYGSIKRGKRTERMALEVDGKLSPNDWERFKAELEQILKKYGIKFGSLQIRKSKKKKRGG
jgi:hypothetical protein